MPIAASIPWIFGLVLDAIAGKVSMPVFFSKTYDALIEKYRRKIPFNLVKALIANESNFRPSLDMNPRQPGSAKGLMQLTGSIRLAFNKAHNADVTTAELLDPRVNLLIGCWHLDKIVRSLAKYPHTCPEWDDTRYLEILVYAWNAGHSDAAGIGYAVSALQNAGVLKNRVNIDNIFQAAKELPGVYFTLKDKRRVSWAKKVIRDMQRLQQGIA